MRVDERGWLRQDPGDPPVEHYPTVRTRRLDVPAPLAPVWHYTAGRGGPGWAERLARKAQTYRRGIDRPASWHLLVARDGAVLQSASVLVGTWHLGVPGEVGGRRFANLNGATVGIELENPGRLRRIGEGWSCWPYWQNPKAPPAERRPAPSCRVTDLDPVPVAGEGTFAGFTREQEDAAVRVLGALVAAFGWTPDVCGYGHCDFEDPGRREDPGPVWRHIVLPRVLATVFRGGGVASAVPAPA